MYRVLLVDDEPILQVGISKMLEDSDDYEISASARNGVEAMQCLQNTPVDMILTDLKMPVMDGVALIKTLKQQQNTTPVIVLSNYSDFELVREALTSGALDYVLKLDLTSEVLLTHLDKLAGHIKTAQISQAESGSRENQELLRSRLRSFFREPQVAGDAAPNLPVMFSTPFLVFTVYYQEGTVKIDRLRRVLPQVESFLKTTVGEIPLISLVLHHNELICMAGVSGERAMIENALKMLQRQLATYFSITPTICYCVGMESLADAKGAYERCREAYGLSFYDSGQTLYCAEEIHMEQGIRPEQVSALTGRILDALHAGDMEQVQQITHDALACWKECYLVPARVRITCQRVLDSIRYSVASSEVPEDFELQQELLEKASTLHETETHFLTAIQLMSKYKGRPFEDHKREVQEVLRYLHTHYTESITLEALAETTYLNRSYLCRVFKREMGTSIFGYLNAFRMKHAAELLLKNGDMYIKKVAVQVGIEDPFYFTRRFKEYYGVSPREYVDTHK